MKRKIIFLMTGMLMFFAVVEAKAASVCWQVLPFTDTIRATVRGLPSDEHRLLNGVWFLPGSYLFALVGSIERELGGGPARRFAAMGSQAQDVGIGTVHIIGTVDNTTLEGNVDVTDSTAALIFSATLDKIPCATAPTPSTLGSTTVGPSAFGR